MVVNLSLEFGGYDDVLNGYGVVRTIVIECVSFHT